MALGKSHGSSGLPSPLPAGGKGKSSPLQRQQDPRGGQTWGGERGFEAVSTANTGFITVHVAPWASGACHQREAKTTEAVSLAGREWFLAHTHAHPLREAPRCRPLSGPQLWHKSDEPGFLTLKGGEGVRAEGRPEAFLSAGPQSCSQAGGVGSGLAARRIPPCQLLGWLSPARASHSVPPGSLGTQGWTHGHGGPRMEGAVADRLGDLGHVLSSSRASVHQL